MHPSPDKTFNENLFETDFITSVQHMPIDPNLMDMCLRLVLKTMPKNNPRKIKRNYKRNKIRLNQIKKRSFWGENWFLNPKS